MPLWTSCNAQNVQNIPKNPRLHLSGLRALFLPFQTGVRKENLHSLDLDLHYQDRIGTKGRTEREKEKCFMTISNKAVTHSIQVNICS
jgi:hypothetical protein